MVGPEDKSFVFVIKTSSEERSNLEVSYYCKFKELIQSSFQYVFEFDILFFFLFFFLIFFLPVIFDFLCIFLVFEYSETPVEVEVHLMYGWFSLDDVKFVLC